MVENVDGFFALSWPGQLAILCHELAHGFDSWDSPQRCDDFQWTDRDEWYTQPGNIDRVCAALGMPHITDEEVKSINHGLTFTRAGLHCWWRCRGEIGLDQLAAFSEMYGSPEPAAAIEALRDELDAGGSILDVMRQPMPEAFAKLWA